MIIISLGCCCETTFVINRIFGNSQRYPFDWLSIHDATEIEKVISSDFDNFVLMDKEPVEWKSLHNNDILYYSRIGLYNMHAVHDIDQNILNRRIERFREKMKSDEYIVFIVKCHIKDTTCIHPYAANLSVDNALKLRDTLYGVKKDKNFLLLVINEKSVEEIGERIVEDNLILDWVIGDVIQGCERGKVVIPCDYSVSHKCFDQWTNILTFL